MKAGSPTTRLSHRKALPPQALPPPVSPTASVSHHQALPPPGSPTTRLSHRQALPPATLNVFLSVPRCSYVTFSSSFYSDINHLEDASLGQAFRPSTHILSPCLPSCLHYCLTDFQQNLQEKGSRILPSPNPRTFGSLLHTLSYIL